MRRAWTRRFFVYLAVIGAMTVSTRPGGAAAEVPSPYLLSVSFYVPSLEEWTAATARAAAASPYRGIAAKIGSAYAIGPAPTVEQFKSVVATIHQNAAGKAVWPWIFVNRIIARSATSAHSGAPAVAREAEKNFAGVDLDGTGGSLQVFYDTWRTALRLAKELGAPGIVFDPEAYSDYGINSLFQLAKMRGVGVDTVSEQTRAIGAKLADITAEEFPHAVILSLFTQYASVSAASNFTPTLCDGMLAEAKAKHIPLQLVDGGETVGYCARNLKHLQRMHNTRMYHLQHVMATYPDHFVPGATIAPWADAAKRTSWLATWSDAKHSDLKTIADFEPLFVELLRRYRYVWIYAASAAPYNPLSAKDQAVYDPVLSKALAEATKLGPFPAAAIGLPDMKNLKPLVPDDTQNAERWRVSGGKEASLVPPSKDQPWANFVVDVDREGGDKKYPSGWLFLNYGLGKSWNIGDAAVLEFDIRFHQPGMIRVGLRDQDSGVSEWESIDPQKIGAWQTERVPAVVITSAGTGHIAGVSWYVAEAWYADHSHLSFDVRNVRILTAGSPAAPTP